MYVSLVVKGHAEVLLASKWVISVYNQPVSRVAYKIVPPPVNVLILNLKLVNSILYSDPLHPPN